MQATMRNACHSRPLALVKAQSRAQCRPTGFLQVSGRPTSFKASRSVITKASFGEGLINKLSVAVKNSPLNNLKKAIASAQAGNYNAEEVRSQVDQYIKNNPVVVFSWTGCPYCKSAKSLLTEIGAKFEAVECDIRDDGDAIRAELAKLTDRTSMPNIFINGKNVGGCNDGPGVMTLQRKGELEPMLREAGAL